MTAGETAQRANRAQPIVPPINGPTYLSNSYPPSCEFEAASNT